METGLLERTDREGVLDAFVPGPSRRRTLGAILVSGGLAALLAAGVGLAAGIGRPSTGTHAVSSPAASVPPAPGGEPVVFDAAGVFVERPTYVPGQTTSWHAHTGVHVVAVLSGALTVYDESCQARTYGAGETYVGGTSAHLARNEDHAPVEMVVTYLSAAGTTLDQFTVPRHAPLNCETQ